MTKKSKKAKQAKHSVDDKLHKQLRKSSEFLSELVKNPVAREVASAALIAAASALATRKDGNAAPNTEGAKKAGGIDFAALAAQGIAALAAGFSNPAAKADEPRAPGDQNRDPKPKPAS